MKSNEAHTRASLLLDLLYSVSTIRPLVRDGQPAWFYDLVSRVALLIGESAVTYVTHNISDDVEQQSTALFFTAEVLVVATVDKTKDGTAVFVCAMGRDTLTTLEIDQVASAFLDNGQPWPSSAMVNVTYGGGRSFVLPLGQGHLNTPDLSALVPSLALDLSARQVTSD